ncbi:PPP4R2-domain-containing protein [Epithele typhae]|uniref:PPP4R2-domain-containing protein n=1 Tax=Epithele typhae TaxID=378194 RepID=UPI0020088D4E|nr:PPP4R2-domain-containing protein [Epithele typhae]KAH9946068.1 PPP4R2-domain-containing protein [Epithele typhae]
MADTLAFEWKEEHGDILEKVASTDIVETEWPLLRSIIKHKVGKNVESFLNDGPRWEPRPPLMIAAPQQLPNGGLKLPPFPSRDFILPTPIPPPPPKVDLTKDEAETIKISIFAQIEDLDDTPFTIQRLCELCVRPRQHYKFVGKYLRAVEKSLLVTSSWDAFPPLSEIERTYSTSGHPSISTSAVSAPNTPIFSPIPFLHEDARRSKSRSPPPSPLVLPSVVSAADASADVKALGLVDELDDPKPGHLSDHIEAISATTTVSGKPLHGSLEERFVKGGSENADDAEAKEEGETSDVTMEDEGKENKAV